jgi:NAD(P)-dependent dehydrogenase (short-subunit alcohol dehydrogenase family)
VSGRLEGKVAIVTGGGSGFGRAIALRFAYEGARVVIGDLDEAGARATIDGIARQLAVDGTSVARFVTGDVSDPSVAARLVAAALDGFGTLTTLVNNAGIAQMTPRDTWDVDPEVWDGVIQTNLRTVYACSRAAIPVIIDAGGGSVVNIASIAASVCVGGAAYAASKGAILSYTRHAARELAGRGVRVNCVSPGFMRSPMTTGERDGLGPDEQEARLAEFGRRVPMRRVGAEADIANAVLFFASDESAYVTGQELVVDGGYVVR